MYAHIFVLGLASTFMFLSDCLFFRASTNMFWFPQRSISFSGTPNDESWRISCQLKVLPLPRFTQWVNLGAGEDFLARISGDRRVLGDPAVQVAPTESVEN